MKLLLCLNCSDVRKLQMKWTYCMCKQSKGRYVDDLNAETKGKYLVPLGLHNIELVEAVYRRPKTGWGPTFTAWVIAEECPTVKQL